jgi:hypothetical protein
MSNAEAALKAAKDLSADSLTPEIYRSASDAYFKAKRDYHLKDFNNARKHALQATRLAEQAEFEAYRLGGATPEIANKAVTPEGSSSDPDSALRERGSHNEPQLDSTPMRDSPSNAPQAEKGRDYEQAVREEEMQRQREQFEREKKLMPQPVSTPVAPGAPGNTMPNPQGSGIPNAFPNGPLGPGPLLAGSTDYNQYVPPGQVPPGTTYNERIVPQTGSAGPVTNSAPHDVGSASPPTDLWNRKNYDRGQINRLYNPLPPRDENIDSVGETPIPESGTTDSGQPNTIENTNAQDVDKPLDSVGGQPIPSLYGTDSEIPNLYSNGKPKAQNLKEK